MGSVHCEVTALISCCNATKVVATFTRNKQPSNLLLLAVIVQGATVVLSEVVAESGEGG